MCGRLSYSCRLFEKVINSHSFPCTPSVAGRGFDLSVHVMTTGGSVLNSLRLEPRCECVGSANSMQMYSLCVCRASQPTSNGEGGLQNGDVRQVPPDVDDELGPEETTTMNGPTNLALAR